MVTFDDICHTYLLRTENLDSFHSLEDARKKRAILREMMRRWPEHAEELMRFAAADSALFSPPT